MMDQSTKWDKQWNELLTRCYGEEVRADAAFKADLLGQLKDKMARNDADAAETEAELPQEPHWRKLLKSAYVPCHPEETFKKSLLTKLKAKQADTAESADATAAEPDNEDVIRTILSKSYQPVEPRREFQTRLLHNLKERQRDTAVTRRTSRRRTIFMSAASSIAAAAMVMFAVWVAPYGTAPSSLPARSISMRGISMRGISLPVPEAAMSPVQEHASSSSFTPVSFVDNAQPSYSVVPASYQPENFQFSNYRVASAFDAPVLPEKAVALNVQLNNGKGWSEMGESTPVTLATGQSFRTSGDKAMGHIKFSDGSLMTLSPDSVIDATKDGLTVKQGFVLVAVPDSSTNPFRIHFPERDLAVAPGTDLALMVENPDRYAEGGAPAPMVMVVDSPDAASGLAFARGKNGVGPLFARQLYRLDNYVTPDMPSRAMCDIECQDLSKLFKEETVYEKRPYASFAGGFSADRDLSYAKTVLVPAGFNKKGDRWVADSYSNQPTVKLQYLSDAYFGFVNERRDLSHALALGSQVILDGGDGNFYEIHK